MHHLFRSAICFRVKFVTRRVQHEAAEDLHDLRFSFMSRHCIDSVLDYIPYQQQRDEKES